MCAKDTDPSCIKSVALQFKVNIILVYVAFPSDELTNLLTCDLAKG